MIADGTFPLDNIAFQIFLDVAEWFGLENTVAMWYSPNVVKFWRIGYRLFHGKFLRFMGGYKNLGQGGRELRPVDSKINFAVPNVKQLFAQKVGVDSISPGILYDLLDILKGSRLCYNLSFDGKKINAGKTKMGGDIDLFGHEDVPTLEQRKARFADEKRSIDEFQQLLENPSVYGQNFESVSSTFKMELIRNTETLCKIFFSKTKRLALK